MALRMGLIAVATLSLVAASAAQTTGSFNPCHQDRSARVIGADSCEKVILPGALTKKCLLKPPQDDGTFTDCTSIYELDTLACRRAIFQYTQLNPCDEKRAANAIGYYRNGDLKDKEELDYFLYTLAEECCDCIPQRPADGTPVAPGTLSVFRGNCAAHAVYDICNVYPNIKIITTPGRKNRTPEASALPYVCPPLMSWLESEASRAWKRQNETVIEDVIVDFLEESMKGLKCKAASIWNACYDLESKQGRV